ncbi:M24 family metallopeptidase [Hyunsoonleella sp. 2307UL5-6]|uniref:M24 family metallopeptidase n=1 Tax=Hyunsoonleella sp. 2307UL5-6 TaxID=3384768 RepID=UPI0039BD7AFF
MSRYGIGGSSIDKELNAITPIAHLAKPIEKEEFKSRIEKACKMMKTQNIEAMYLNAGTNLYYFTGTRWNSSERMVGAILYSNTSLEYIAPEFEIGTILDFMLIEGKVNSWQEHESPYALFSKLLAGRGIGAGSVYMDETTPFFITNGILKCNPKLDLIDAKPITSGCRMIKSKAEIDIIKIAMDITLEVQKAAARILKVGISAKAVTDFIHEAHKRYGINSGSYFCIVLFGEDTAFPHGVKHPKHLKENDIVLIDTGCKLQDYISDITRTYSFGNPTDYQKRIWNIEKETQLAAFKAITLGNTCGAIDKASRRVLEFHDLGPDYKLPGLPHRTGHGIGLDIHEWPYIVDNDDTILKSGLCFSIEPMICVPNQFGIRLEDHVYIKDNKPYWFTEPMYSIENPFGIRERS